MKHVRAFRRKGWEVARQTGSHVIMTKPGARATLSIPDHGDVKRGLLMGSLKAADISVEDYLEVYK